MARRKKRVFIISEGDDIGGVAIAIQRALEKQNSGWEVRSMRGSNNYIDYPVDLSWDRARFDELWAWADVIHAMERTMNLTGAYNPPGKPVVLHHHGQVYRWSADALNELADAHNLVVMCSTIDMEALSPRTQWLPNPVDVDWMQNMRAQYRPDPFRATVRFFHSPTAFRGAKGTDQWIPAVKAAGGELKLVEGKPWINALADKATCDVHLDQLLHCYGNSGLEAMGMGLPVVSGGVEEMEAGVIAKVGYLPYHPAMNRVHEAVMEMLDPKVREEVAARCWQYINDYHAQDKVVARLKQFYTEAMDRYDPTEAPW